MKVGENKKIPGVELLDAKIWQALEVLRGTRLNPDDYYILLFFLLLKIEGFLDKNEIDQDLWARKVKAQSSKYSHSLLDLFSHFKPTLKKINKTALRKIFEILGGYTQRELNKWLPELFDSFLYGLDKTKGRSGGENLQPVELTRFVISVAALPRRAKIYNPFAGFASLGIYFNEGQDYFGQEINPRVWSIGLLRLLAHKRKGKTKFLLQDSVEDWNPESEQFDLIVAHPPMLPWLQSYAGNFDDIKTHEQFLIDQGLASLKPKGKLIAIVPNRFLFGPGFKKLRMHLIESDCLEIVVSLPGGILRNTNVPFSVIVINKSKDRKQFVRFVDASNCVDRSEGSKYLNDHLLLATVKQASDSNYVITVPTQSIKESNYNINPKRYFLEDIEGVELREILERAGEKFTEGGIGKFVGISQLSKGRFDYELDVSDLPVMQISKYAKKIDESVLLFATRWRTPKPTLFNYRNEHIFVSPNIAAFRINTEKVLPEYLVNEFYLEYVKKQLRAFRVGEYVPMIRINDLLSVRIMLPSIEEQKAKVLGMFDALVDVRESQAMEDAAKYSTNNLEFSEFASLKHTLGAPRQNILSHSNVIIKFLENQDSECLRQVCNNFKSIVGDELIDIVQSIRDDINYISELLEKSEQGFSLQNHELEILTIQNVEALILGLKNARYKFGLKIKPTIGVRKDEIGIQCNRTLLQIMLDNILENANKYGFEDGSPENELIIELNVIEDEFILDIRNNGKPFPKGYDKGTFIRKYTTSDAERGSGLGGHDINRIAEYFEAKWDLILNESRLYPVRFIFRFTITAIT